MLLMSTVKAYRRDLSPQTRLSSLCIKEGGGGVIWLLNIGSQKDF